MEESHENRKWRTTEVLHFGFFCESFSLDFLVTRTKLWWTRQRIIIQWSKTISLALWSSDAAARLVSRISPRDCKNSMEILIELHWLPVTFRIDFKIHCQIFKTIHSSTAPRYLAELVEVQQSTRSLRSNSIVRLQPPSGNFLVDYGERAVKVYAFKLWNGLPVKIRRITNFDTFKSATKTYLYREFLRRNT